MLERSELFRTREYWIERIQNDIFRALHNYKEEKNLKSDTALAKELGFSKGYVSQIMNGNFNFSISKLVDLALKVGVSPELIFQNIEDYIIKEERRLERLNKHGIAKVETLIPQIPQFIKFNDEPGKVA